MSTQITPLSAGITLTLPDTTEGRVWLLVWLTRKMWRLEGQALSAYPWSFSPEGPWLAAFDFGSSRGHPLAPNGLNNRIQADLGATSVLVLASQENRNRQWLAQLDGEAPIEIVLRAQQHRLTCEIRLHPKLAERPWALETLTDMLLTLRVTWPDVEITLDGLGEQPLVTRHLTPETFDFVACEIWKQVGCMRSCHLISPPTAWYTAQVSWFDQTICRIIEVAESRRQVPSKGAYLDLPKVLAALQEPPGKRVRMYFYLP